jgi:hypothetical protein
MKPKTVSFAKNIMRRAIEDLVDPPPRAAEQRALRAYFGNRCCYCGGDAPERLGHIDHATPGGGNHLGNFVLACATCNGDEKREQGWNDFLTAKCPDAEIRSGRHAKISEWFEKHPRTAPSLSIEVADARRHALEMVEAYADACSGLHAAIDAARHTAH